MDFWDKVYDILYIIVLLEYAAFNFLYVYIMWKRGRK